MRPAILIILLLLAGCGGGGTSLPTKNGDPDGAVYPQTKAQCEAQPTSPWCTK